MKALAFVFSFFIAAYAFGQSSDVAVADISTKPSLKWKFSISTPILSSPVIDDNAAYFGGLDSVFYSLDVHTGKVKWKFRTQGQIRSTALIKGNALYLNGGDGKLYALDKKSGKVQWTFSTAGEKKYDFADYHQSSPVFQNGVLYFGSGDGNIYAVRAETGKQVWKFQTGDLVHGTPALANGKLFVGSFDGYVYALSETNGALLWKFKTVGHRYFPKGEVQGSPAVNKNLVFVGARDFNVYAIDQEKGYCHWNKYLTRGWGLVNNIHDSVLHIGGADERTYISVRPETGYEYWNKKMEFLTFGRSAYSKTMLYTGTTIGKLHGMDIRTGKTAWTFTTDGYEKNHLKYFKPDDSNRDDIYSIITSNEQFLDVEFELGGIFSTPALSKDYLVITTGEGTVYCLGR